VSGVPLKLNSTATLVKHCLVIQRELLVVFAAEHQIIVDGVKCSFLFQTKHHYNTALVERLIHIMSIACQPGISCTFVETNDRVHVFLLAR